MTRRFAQYLSLALALGACGEKPSNAPEQSGGANPGGAASAAAGTAVSGVAGTTSGGTAPQSGGNANGGSPAQGGSLTAAGGIAPLGGAPPSDGGKAGRGNEGGNDSASNCAVDPAALRLTSTWDPLGYPPYALDGCRLAYIASDGSLRLRSLDDNSEEELEPATAAPRRPTLKGETIAWEAKLEGKGRIRVRSAGQTVSVGGDFDHAEEPVAAEGAVVFTAFKGPATTSDSDVLLYDVATGSLSEAFTGPGQQRFADLSADYIAASDFSEDPAGVFNEMNSQSDIILRERASGRLISRPLTGKQAFPLLGEDGALAYLDWGAVHPEPKFSAFDLFLGSVDGLLAADVKIASIETDPRYVRPSFRDNVIDFVDRSSGSPLLHRYERGAAEGPAPIGFPTGVVPLGPIASKTFTLLGASTSAGIELRVVQR